MFGTLIAFLAATAKPVFDITIWPHTSNFIIIAVIVANEATMSKWRVERDIALEDIEARQDEFERSMNSKSGAVDGKDDL